MRYVLTAAVLAGLLAAPAGATSLGPDVVLAEWNDGKITVREYVDWYKQLPAGEKDTLDTAEAKRAFLENMINAELMLAEAESLGIDKHEDMRRILEKRRFSAVSTAILDRAMARAAEPDEREVEAMYREQLAQVDVLRIMVDTHDQVMALMDSIAAGVPFEDLAYRYSTDVTGERGGFLGTLRKADLEEPWRTQVFRLEEGEVSEPFYTPRGWAIVKVDRKAVVEPENPEAMRQGIRRRIKKANMFDEQAAYIDSLNLAYNVHIYGDAVIGLCADYALAMGEEGERPAVVSEDIVPDLTEEQKKEPVATFTGWIFTCDDVVNAVLSHPYPARPTLDDPQSMMAFIGRQVKDSLIVAEARKLGAYDWPDVKTEVERARRRRYATRVYRTLTRDVEVPADSIRAEFERHRERYATPAGHTASKIVVATRSAADSILALLEEGESFEDLARRRSIDPFTAPKGGSMGFMPLGRDVEFDGFFETMEVGETKYFRSLEGHVILRLEERREAKPATFEEAAPVIRKNLIDYYRSKALEEWLAAERETRGVKVYPERLEPIVLVP